MADYLILATLVLAIATVGLVIVTWLNVSKTSKVIKETYYSRIQEIETKIFPKIEKFQIRSENSEAKADFIMALQDNIFNLKVTFIGQDNCFFMDDRVYFYTGLSYPIQTEKNIIGLIEPDSDFNEIMIRAPSALKSVKYIVLDYLSKYYNHFVDIYEVTPINENLPKNKLALKLN